MRLTNEFREQLIGIALTRAFKDRDEAHRVATVQLADDLYQRTHGDAEKIARKLPQGWVDHSNVIRIEAAGYYTPGANTARKSNQLTMSRARPFPRFNAQAAVKVTAQHPLNTFAQMLADEHLDLRNEKETLRRQLHGLVYSVTTLAKLLEVWPEAVDILPPSAPKPQRAVVPVGLVQDINARLGLGVKG